MIYIQGLLNLYEKEQPELDENGEHTGDYVVRTDMVKVEMDKASNVVLDDLIDTRKRIKELETDDDGKVEKRAVMRVIEDMKGWS